MKKKLKKKLKKARRPLYRKPKDERKPKPRGSRKPPKHVKAAIPVRVPELDIKLEEPKPNAQQIRDAGRQKPTSLRLSHEDKALIARLGQKWNIPGTLLPVLRKAMEIADRFAA